MSSIVKHNVSLQACYSGRGMCPKWAAIKILIDILSSLEARKTRKQYSDLLMKISKNASNILSQYCDALHPNQLYTYCVWQLTALTRKSYPVLFNGIMCWTIILHNAFLFPALWIDLSVNCILYIDYKTVCNEQLIIWYQWRTWLWLCLIFNLQSTT
jgi:hypothetical protein